ncbi:hypothetical protein WN943_001270 [Citrus x changshan-huyou]
MEEIQHKLHKRFPSLPQNALKKIYKARCERLHLLMINGILADIHWLIKGKVRLVGEFSDPFVSYMPGFGKSTFAKKRRDKRLSSQCPHCVRLACNKPHCKTLGMVSVDHEDKIKFVKDGMSKESIVPMVAIWNIQLKNICVLSRFCYGKYKEFVQAAIDLGRAIAKRKLHLVYGGGDRGLSKLIS